MVHHMSHINKKKMHFFVHPTMKILAPTTTFVSPIFFNNQRLRHKYHTASVLLSKVNEKVPLKIQRKPVIIVGGGPVGLFLSILLSDYNVPHILLERQSITSRFRHPQAHFINTRSMELFRTVPNTTTTTTTSSSSSSSSSSPSTQQLPPSMLYERIQRAMAPVRHWQSFRYGIAIHDRNPLAEIIHPVDRPLQSNCDANGHLLQLRLPTSEETTSSDSTTTSTGSTTTTTTTTDNFDLSPCTVGHLAQHTLGRILYDTAMEKCDHLNALLQDDTVKSQILYDTSVEQIEWIVDRDKTGKDQSPVLRVVTKSQNTIYEYYSDLVIGADGAHSTVRQLIWNEDSTTSQSADNFAADNIEQHLINVHVTIPIDIANEIHTKHDNYAMLYSVYTSEVIAVIVCHTIGEYVIQIPYFPPYQTVENDFTHEKVLSYIDVIFGYPDIAQQCHIHSIAPWTMTSWIAKQYHQLSSSSASRSRHQSTRAGVVLVGDAAHVFPPAGGFGMNTGLQDVHNLAWKIAAHRHCETLSKGGTPSNDRWTLPQMLKSYEQERRPIAQQNAALSIRNYERLLEVTKTLYLNAQHPALLCTLLDHSPLPISARQDIFRTLLNTALYPLSWLRTTPISENADALYSKTGSEWLSYANHIRSNLRQILQNGSGLPLLFPRYEIGFTYQSEVSFTMNTSTTNTNDTMPEQPHLAIGRLIPHICVYVTSGNEHHFPNLKYVRSGSLQISTTDLPTQMKHPNETNPIFVLLHISTTSNTSPKESVSRCAHLCQAIQHRIGLPVKVAIIENFDQGETLVDGGSSIKRDTVKNSRYLLLAESMREPQAFSFFTPTTKLRPCYILIRPDGHIAGIVKIPTTERHPELATSKIVDKLVEKSY